MFMLDIKRMISKEKAMKARLNDDGMFNKARAWLLNDYAINEKFLTGEKHDGISFVLHNGMAAKPLVADRCRFYESIHLSQAMHSAGKVEKTIDFETKKHKEQKAQEKKAQKQKAQAIGVSICCNQKIKAS